MAVNEDKIIEFLATGYSHNGSTKEKVRSAAEKPVSSGVFKFILELFQDPVVVKNYKWLKELIDNSYASAKYIDINNISVNPDEVFASAEYKEAIKNIKHKMEASNNR